MTSNLFHRYSPSNIHYLLLYDNRLLGNHFYTISTTDQNAKLHANFCYDRAILSPYAYPDDHEPVQIISMINSPIDELNGVGGYNFNTLRVLSVLLTNIALCCANIGEITHAIRYSILAKGMDKTNPKANYRFLSALHQINPKASLSYIEDSLADENVQQSVKKEIKKLKDKILIELKEKNVHEENDADVLSWCMCHDAIIDPEAETIWDFAFVSKGITWKERCNTGRKLFKDNQFLEAKRAFLEATYLIGSSLLEDGTTLIQEISKIFSNRAAVSLAGNSPTSQRKINLIIALESSSQATMLDPIFLRSRMRQFKALQDLGHIPRAQLLMKQYLTILQSKKFPKACKWISEKDICEQIKLMKIAIADVAKFARQNTKIKALSKKTRSEQLKERDMMLQSDEQGDLMSAEDVEQMGIMWRSIPKKKLKELKIEKGGDLLRLSLLNKMPKFHLDFAKECSWPKGLHNKKLCERVLYSGYAHALMYPIQDIVTALAKQKDDSLQKLERDSKAYMLQLLKRFHGSIAMIWLNDEMKNGRTVGHGEILAWRSTFNPPPLFQYNTCIRSNFANSPHCPKNLNMGTAHVAVGNNDLGELLASIEHLLPPPKDEWKTKSLYFIGIDASPFSVAKTQVITEMLKSKSTPLSHVLQAWYSSSWNRKVVKSWKSAVHKVLEQDQNNLGHDPNEVQHILSYLYKWASAEPCSLLEARRQWFESHHFRKPNDYGKEAIFIANLIRKIDRHAACAYILTGDVFPRKSFDQRDNDEPEVGSLAMWSVPPNSPPIEMDMIYNIISIPELLIEMEKKKSERNINEILTDMLMRQLKLLRESMLNSKIEVRLICQTLCVDNDSLINRISEMKPWSMSWSNCIDYFSTYETFHALARRCSQHGDTIHFAYSMNWPSEIMGANMMDYPNEAVLEMFDTYTGEMHLLWKAYSFDKLFTFPAHDVFLNISNNLLTRTLYENWSEYFFGCAKLSKSETLERILSSRTGCFLNREEANERFHPTAQNCGLTIGSVLHEGPLNPLQRTASTSINLVWTYDPMVTLTPNTSQI